MFGKQKDIWFFTKDTESKRTNESFYEADNFDWAKNIESQFELISKEISNYIDENEERIKPYFNDELVNSKTSWKTVSFFFWKWKVRKNFIKCPKTMTILSKNPNVLSASISILEPGVEIKTHRGDTDAIYRCHLALSIPEGLPNCGLQVNNEKRSWKEGEILIFNDAARHSAWNLTSQRRYVLIIDVLRTEFINKKYRVCSRVLGRLLLQSYIQKAPFLLKFPKVFLRLLFSLSAGLLRIVLPMRNMFS